MEVDDLTPEPTESINRMQPLVRKIQVYYLRMNKKFTERITLLPPKLMEDDDLISLYENKQDPVLPPGYRVEIIRGGRIVLSTYILSEQLKGQQ